MIPASITTPIDLLIRYQRKLYDETCRFVCAIWSRQTGKDFTATCKAVAHCKLVPRTTYVIAAPSERQSVESLGKAREHSTAFDLVIDDEQIERPDGPGTLMKSGSITFANGSRIIAVPGRPDTVRGFSANLILTEFAFFDDPDATWKAVLPSITNPLRGGEKNVLIISTPNGKGGQGARFFKIVDENLLNPKPGRKQPWAIHKVTIEDAVRDGLPVNIAELREALDDEEAWAQEFMCEFLDGSSVLLPYDLIALAESSEASEAADPALFLGGASTPFQLFCGIDFGRVGDPTVCWTLERVGELLITREVLVLQNTDSPDQQAILRARILASRRTCYDFTGPGIGLGDYLVKDPELGQWKPDEHKFGKIELFTFTTQSKRLLFPILRSAFESKPGKPTILRIPVSVNIREDLHAMQQIIRNGEYTYAAPRTAKGHSDRCTALALARRAAGDEAHHLFAPKPFNTRRSMSIRARRASHRGEDRS